MGTGRPTLYTQGVRNDLPENRSTKFRMRMLALWAINDHIEKTGINLVQLAKKFHCTPYFLSRLNHTANNQYHISMDKVEQLLYNMGYTVELTLVNEKPLHTVQVRRSTIRKNNLL